jgi:hypothetical protein
MNAVIYHYFEADASHFRNLNFFLQRGIRPELAIYIFHASPIGNLANMYPEIQFIEVENKDYDFAGYSSGANLVSAMQGIDNVFFLNSGVLGPILPGYFLDWWKPFTELLDEDTKLVGTTIASPKNGSVNIEYLQSVYPRNRVSIAHHVQTMFFAMDFKTLVNFVQEGLFSGSYGNDKQSLVHNFELLMSWKILGQGFNISSVLKSFQGIDYKTLEFSRNNFAVEGDPYVKNGYFGMPINPYDVIFYKTSRNLLSEKQVNLLLGLDIPSPAGNPFLNRISRIFN